MKFLFDVYKKKHGPRFGSRFMKLLGNLLMGTPESKGWEGIRKDLLDTYYWDKNDRVIPVPELDEWMEQSVLVNEYRQVETPAVAKATSLALAVASILLVVAGTTIGNTRDANAIIKDMDEQRCEAFQAAVVNEQVPANMARFKSRIGRTCKPMIADAGKKLAEDMSDEQCQEFGWASAEGNLPARWAAHADVLSKRCAPAIEAQALEITKDYTPEDCEAFIANQEADAESTVANPYVSVIVNACKTILKK